jgi:hypothetical protein
MTGAATSESVFSIASAGALSGIGGAIGAAAATVACSSTATLVGSTLIDPDALSWITFNNDLTTDEVLGASAWSTVGSPTRDTTTKKFGAASIRGNSSADGVQATVDIPSFESGLAAWCIKGWVQFDNGAGNTVDAWFEANDGAGNLGIQVSINTFSGFTLGLFQIRQNNSLVAEVTGTAGGLGSRDTAFNHFAATYDGTTYRFFWNGVLKHSSVDSDRASVTPTSGHRLKWFTEPNVDLVRIDNVGFFTSAEHTTNFTPPTTEGEGFTS